MIKPQTAVVLNLGYYCKEGVRGERPTARLLVSPAGRMVEEVWSFNADLAGLKNSRRYLWPDCKEASSNLRLNSKFFAPWNPLALESYIKFGVIEKDFFSGVVQEGGTGLITLKCDRLSKPLVFVDQFFRYQAFYH
ncbi:hypothetical protein BY996DRAFT_6410625 [Phakopsora pachyrhizi]|nr:hypothetical protein BY996DRAFT_6410625 [Phakopsora pachyrhizi]